LKCNYSGCAICDSTWGNLWEEVDGQRLFFCCSICVVQFRALLRRMKDEHGWPHLDALEIQGDRRGLECIGRWGSESLRVHVTFNPEGEILKFERLDSPGGPSGRP
jgi:hypothetical protein